MLSVKSMVTLFPRTSQTLRKDCERQVSHQFTQVIRQLENSDVFHS